MSKTKKVLLAIALGIILGYMLIGVEVVGWNVAVSLTTSMFTQFISVKSVPVAYARTIEHNQINPKQLDDIARKIQILESSGGKNDGCKRKGMVNGYGYRQNSTEIKCFDSKTDVKRLVEGWFYDKFNSGYTLSQAVCEYNTGKKLNDCNYFKKFQTV